MPLELISLLGGGLAGFVFRYLAQRASDQKEMFVQLLAVNKQTTENQDKAALRVPLDVGKVVRQTIVLVVLFGTVTESPDWRTYVPNCIWLAPSKATLIPSLILIRG